MKFANNREFILTTIYSKDTWVYLLDHVTTSNKPQQLNHDVLCKTPCVGRTGAWENIEFSLIW